MNEYNKKKKKSANSNNGSEAQEMAIHNCVPQAPMATTDSLIFSGVVQ